MSAPVRVAIACTAWILIAWCFDGNVAQLLRQPIESGQTKAVLRALRCWGEGATLVILVAGLILANPSQWRKPIAMLLITLACAAVISAIKPIVGRPRPSEVGHESIDRSNSSFPSGHAATAFAFARTLSLAHPAVQPVAVIAASGTALSRMYDQRHYLSDCVAGGLIGWLVSAMLWRAVDRCGLLAPVTSNRRSKTQSASIQGPVPEWASV